MTHRGVLSRIRPLKLMFDEGLQYFRAKISQLVNRSRAPVTCPWNYETHATQVPVATPVAHLPHKRQSGGHKMPLTVVRTIIR